MPPVIPFIAAVAGVISVAQAIFISVVSLYGSYQAKRLERRARAAASQVISNARAQTFRQPITHWRLVYGQVLVGGPITFIHSTHDNRRLHVLVTLAAHAVAEVGDVYLNDERIELAVDGAAGGRWAGAAWIWRADGTPAGDAGLHAALTAAVGEKWTADHKQAGHAKIYAQFHFSSELFRSGLPSVRAIVKGKPVYDPRTGLTSWTNNWALAIRDYLALPADVGLGAAGELDEDSFMTAASVADESVAVQPEAAGVEARRLAAPAPAMAADPTPEGGAFFVYYSITFVTAAGETTGSHTVRRFEVQSDVIWTNANNGIALSDIPTGPAGVIARKIYRSELRGNQQDPGDAYFLAATLNDNTTTAHFDDNETGGSFGAPTGAAIPTENTTLPTHLRLLEGHYFRTGDAVEFTTDGTLPGGLLAATTYFWITRGGGHENVALSLADARAGVAVALTSTGSGTHTATRVAEPRYGADGVIFTEDRPREILQDLLTAGSGRLIFAGGAWTLHAGAFRTAAITLDANDLDGAPAVTTRLGRRALFNAVKGVCIHPDKAWQPDDFPPVTNSTYLAEDNDERIWAEIELPYTLSRAAAQRIAKIQLERVRQQITVRWPAKLTAFPVPAGDNILLDYARFGWNAKPFEVIDFEFAVRGGEAPRLGVDLFLRETASSVFDWASGEETVTDPAPDTDLPDPFAVEAPVLNPLESGTAHLFTRRDGTVFSRLFVSWAAHANAFVTEGGHFDIQYRRTGLELHQWSKAPPVDGSETLAYLLDVNDTETYFVRVRAVNNLGARSEWSVSEAHTVVGKTADPTDASGLSFDGNFLTWDEIADLDRLGAVVRFQPEDENNWNTAQPAHKEGFLTDTRFDARDLVGGRVRLLVRWLDTSRNLSANAASIVVDLRPVRPNVFTVARQPDGTREFTWETAAPPDDLAGARIRWLLGATSDYDAMTALHEGLLTASPHENNQLAAGEYTFAVKNVDEAGNASESATFIQVLLGDPRIAGALEDIQESPTWTGTKTDCHVDAGTGWLIADDQATWSTLPATWDEWASWISDPVGTIQYLRKIDIGLVAAFVPLVSVSGDGAITIEERHSDDDVNYTAFAPLGSQVTARFIEIRVTAVGSFPKLKTMRTILSAELIEDTNEDLDTSTLAGAQRIGVGDIRLPLGQSFSVIKQVHVTLQGTGGGWSWKLIDKDTTDGPRIQIYDSTDTLADSLIDTTVRGLPA